MTLYQGKKKNWQITVMIWAPMQKTANPVKTCLPDRVFTHAGAFSLCVDEILKSLLRQIQLTLKASKIRKNFQFHTRPMKDVIGSHGQRLRRCNSSSPPLRPRRFIRILKGLRIIRIVQSGAGIHQQGSGSGDRPGNPVLVSGSSMR
jgi:hypothetical protein